VRSLLLLLCLCALPAGLLAAPVIVNVYEPYLELHTGPGRGYPITFVVPRGEEVTILKRRTDWFKVRDSRGREGWANRDAMAATFTASGKPLPINDPSREQFGEHERELGVLAGDFGGANVITAYGAYAFNPHLAAELRLSQLLGNSSDGQILALGLTHVFRPDWRIQPFVSMGTGMIRIQPKATLVQTPDRTDQLAYVGAGVKAYMSRRFIFRAEYNKYVVFTERDDNQEANEWKLGFAFFF
jgi:uncharacterized protein YgiM (DUF1202 family)